MKKLNTFLLGITLGVFFSTQVQATFLVTSNLSKIEVSGSVDDFASGLNDGYSDGTVYSSTAIPVHVTQEDPLAGEASIISASAGSNAELNLDIARTTNGYSIFGSASSSASNEMDSLDDNDANSKGEAVVDLAFTLSSDYVFSFTSELFDAAGTGESEVELINGTTGNTVFAQIVSEDALTLDFSGNLLAGDYTLFLGALSEATDGDFASADLKYDLQLAAVPLPAALPLLLTGLAVLGFKSRIDIKA